MNLLFASDGSDDARNAERFCLEFLKPADHRAMLTTVIETNPWMAALESHLELGPPVTAECEVLARDFLEAERQAFDVAGWTVETSQREGHVVPQLGEQAQASNADLIIAGAHGHTRFMEFLLGGVSDKLVKHARTSVMIVRTPTPRPPKPEGELFRVLLAYDGSDNIDRSIEILQKLKLRKPLHVTIVRVLELVEAFNLDAIQHSSTDWNEDIEEARESLKTTAWRLKGIADEVHTELHEGGDVSNEILKAADELQPDLIMIGHRGRSAIQTFLLGSVAYRVASHAKGSVLIVK